MFPQRLSAAAALGGRGSLPTRDVRALAPVAVVAGHVPAAVGHAADSLDPEIAVIESPVPRQRRGAAIDVEAILPSPIGEVCDQQAVAVLLSDQEPVAADPADAVSADDVARAPDQGVLDAEPDPGSAGMTGEGVRGAGGGPPLDAG